MNSPESPHKLNETSSDVALQHAGEAKLWEVVAHWLKGGAWNRKGRITVQPGVKSFYQKDVIIGGPLSCGPVGDLICRGESNCDYNAYNRGVAGDTRDKIDFAQITFRELMRRQSLPECDPNRIFAAGKYQVSPKTMKRAVEYLNISLDDQFAPQVQEAIMRYYLMAVKRAEIRDYITRRRNNLKKAQDGLAAEWASVADRNTGLSKYDGIRNNRASNTADEAATALQAARLLYHNAIGMGKTPAQAYLSATGDLVHTAGEAANVIGGSATVRLISRFVSSIRIIRRNAHRLSNLCVQGRARRTRRR